MNYITSCPACGTQFLLTDEDIRAHRGKVQCGSCEQVFNAKNRVTEIPEDVSTPEEFQAFLDQNEETIEARKTVIEEDAPSVEDVATENEREDEGEEDVIIAEATADAAIEIDAIDKKHFGEQKTDEDAKPPVVVEYSVVEEPAFLQQKAKQERSSTWPIILSLLLIVGAALQTIYHMRSKIAAYYPQFKPALVQACAHLKCKVELPRTLNLITIGDSDMQEDEDYESVINFASTIINTANYAQAYPNIKLTLTNGKDKPVIEKLIAPTQYLEKGVSIKKGIAAREEIRMKLSLLVKDTPVAGYRVHLIYN